MSNAQSSDIVIYDLTSSSIETESSSTLNSLSDKDIFLNVSTIDDLCSTWKSRTTSLNLSADRVATDFKVLTSYGIIENYTVCLSTAINSLVQSVNQISKQVSNAKEQQVSVDYEYSSNNSSINSNYYTSTGSNLNTETITNVDNNVLNLNINTSTVFEQLNIEDCVGVAVELYSIANNRNINIENLIESDIELDLIKRKLLQSPNISDSLKEFISIMNVEMLKQFLKQMNSSNILSNIVSEDIGYLHDYLERVASLNNITIDSLLNDTNNSKLLYNSVNYYIEATKYLNGLTNNSVFAIRETLLKVYDGNEIGNMDSNLISSVRMILESIASKHEMSCEDLIDNVDLIGSELKNFSYSKML